MRIEELMGITIERLTPLSDTPQLDAQVLIAHILNKPRTWVMAHTENTLTSKQQDELNDSLSRLERGESFPYVLGTWEFFGLEFEVTKDVLIPRPETELLVEKAITWLHASADRRTVADVGTGSGIIAVTIARHIPQVRILATDISTAALEVARRNAIKFNVIDRIDFVECDLLPDRGPRTEGPSAPFVLGPLSSVDLLCANLPYIPTDILHGLPIYGREPTLALDGGMDGLEVFRRLLKLAPDWLAPHGGMVLEIEATQGPEAVSLAAKSFPTARVQVHEDLEGRDRLLEISLQ